MRYSNIHESFFDFIKAKKKEEINSLLNRIQNFLDKNLQYGFDSNFMLPGLCPLKKMAESIVITEKKLKNFIKSINYDTMKLYRVNSKIWNGDVVVLMPTKTTKGKSFNKSYNPSIESFYDYLNQYQEYPTRRRYTKKKYYDPYGNYRYRSRSSFVSESFFSDFMSWLKGGEVEKEELNVDNAIFQLTHFLVKYPGYDYDKQNDTPGLIFLTTLANSIQIPYNLLLDFFKKNNFENSEIINFRLGDIEGPVVVFGKPSVDRKSQWDSWNAELSAKSEEDLQDIADASVNIEKEIQKDLEIESEKQTSQKVEPEEVVNKPDEVVSSTIDSNTISKISTSCGETFINVIIKRVKADSSSPKQKMLLNIFNSLAEDDKGKLIEDFVKNLLTNQFDYLKSTNISDKIFDEINNQKIVKKDIGNETIAVHISNLIWSDPKTLQMILDFYKSSENNYTSINIKTEPDIEVEKEDVKETEPSATENIMRNAKFSKKVLEQLKLNVTDKNSELYEIINNPSYEDDIIKAIRLLVENVSKFSDSEKSQVIGNVFIEYSNEPNKFFVKKDINSASELFSIFIITIISDMFLQKIKEIEG